MESCVKSGSFSMRLVVVYRPPYSVKHPITIKTFIAEFTDYLETIILSAEPLFITGDFNIHVDDSNDENASHFLDMLESMGLIQHVNVPTHEHGHVLDLVVTRHAVAHCSLNSVKPGASIIQSITYRKLKTIDLDMLRGELAKSRLCTEEIDNLDELVSCYNSTLSSLMDKHAPLQSRNVINRPRIPCGLMRSEMQLKQGGKLSVNGEEQNVLIIWLTSSRRRTMLHF